MQKQLMAALMVGSMAATGAALASEDLAKSAGCLKCHSVDKKKMGPAFKAVAADFKKKGLSGDKAVAKMKEVHEADDIKGVKSDADLKAIMGWVLSQ